jgi:hypothetical protein
MVSEREEFEDTKGVIKISISKNRQRNGQPNKYKRTKNDLPSIALTKDQLTGTRPRFGGELRCCGRVVVFCYTSGTHRVNKVEIY